MNKKFEYIDDNPGSYFEMLVESIEDKEDTKKKKMNESTKHIDKLLKEQKEVTRDEKIKAISSNPEARKQAKELTDKGELPFNSIVDFVYADFFGKDESLKESYSKSDLYSALEYMYGFNKKEANDWIKKASDKMKQSVVDGWKGNAKKSALTDSLKEDKFVPQDKMSKKAQKELNDKKRGTWGNTSPVTKVQPNKKAYDRKRDKKAIEEDFDNDVVTLVNLLSDRYCDEDGNVSKDSYNSIYNYLGKNYSEKIRDAVMDELVTEFGLPAERDKKAVDESLTEDSEVFKDMSNELDEIEYLCNDKYNWGMDEWNDKNNVKNTAERIIDSANVLLDSIKKY